MRNPLRKRIIRELLGDFGKYFVIFALLVGMIGLVSGFLVADESMIKAYNESFDKYNIEDGNFSVQNELNRAQRKNISKHSVTIYPLFYSDKNFDAVTEENGSIKLRIFKKRTDVNLECLMDGDFPVTTDEIAIDRMFADNNGLGVGDTLTSEGEVYTISGLVALSDYSTMFEDNSDTMFDSLTFGVAVVTSEKFAEFSSEEIIYKYAWKYDNPPQSEVEEKDMGDDLMENLSDEVTLTEYIPRYQNQAITFTGEDMGSDRAMMSVLLYILIAIIAFVFAVTISNTIQKEANVIGTLRASGYTKNELVAHYMTLPLIVTLFGAAIGNILGYTFFKDIMAGLYYHSYSLPTYVTIWSAQAFVETTIVPFVIMLAINFVVLRYKLSLPPLNFLRRDLARKKRKRALHLSSKIGFFTRFRIRVILQNMSNYIVVFIGILFANLLLLFGLGLPDLLNNYEEEILSNAICDYQYILEIPLSMLNDDDKLNATIAGMMFMSEVETENPEAEKFSVYTLKTLEENNYKTENIMLYGVESDSRYVDISGISDGEVMISASYAEKYGLNAGDEITLKEIYDPDTYTFSVGGVYDYSGAVCVFMPREDLNRTFDYDDDFFAGYFSNSPITDIDSDYIATVIDMNALTKVSRQLMTSMGGMADLVNGMAVILFIIIIYLMSKMIIEKNAQSISMTKILGYGNFEIAKLYIISTSIVVILCVILTIPLEMMILKPMFETMMKQEMAGWIRFIISDSIYVKMFFYGLISYLVVAFMEYRKIRKVPMDEALKNVE